MEFERSWLQRRLLRVIGNEFSDGCLYGTPRGANSAECFCDCDQHGGIQQDGDGNRNHRFRCRHYRDARQRFGSSRGDSTVQRVGCGDDEYGSDLECARNRVHRDGLRNNQCYRALLSTSRSSLPCQCYSDGNQFSRSN